MNKRKLSRRDFLNLSAAAATGTLLAACVPLQTPEKVETVAVEAPTAAPEPTTAAPAREPVTIRWSNWMGAEQATQQQKCLDEGFTPQYPDITVTIEWAAWADYHTKLLTALSAGTAPDLFWVARWYSNDYIIKGQVLDPATYIDADPEVQAALETEFPQTYLQNCMWQGKLWGMPFGGGTNVLWWNRQHFEEAGIDDPYTQYKAGKWDWDAFVTTAQAMTKKKASGEVERYGFFVEALTWPYWTADFVWQAGGEAYDMSATPPTIAINSPAAKAAFEFIHDLYYKHQVSPLPGAVQGINVHETGLVSMFNYWDGSATQWNPEGQDLWGFAPLPEGPAGRFAQGGCNPYFINARSQHPDEAWLLEKHLSLEAELCWFKNGFWSYIGANSILNSPDFLTTFQGKPAELVAENRQFNRNVLQPLGAADFENVFNPELDLYFLNEKSIDEVLASAQEQGDAILATAYEAADIEG